MDERQEVIKACREIKDQTDMILKHAMGLQAFRQDETQLMYLASNIVYLGRFLEDKFRG